MTFSFKNENLRAERLRAGEDFVNFDVFLLFHEHVNSKAKL